MSLAGDGVPPDAPEFDIINVGTFAESRKNQGALLPLTARHRIAFVGSGALMAEARRGVAKRANAQFFRRLPHAEVFAVLRRSAIMVHTSKMDGLPRATVEAMACGLPVIAFRETIDGGIPASAGFLVAEEAMPHAVDLLLADPDLRRRMGVPPGGMWNCITGRRPSTPWPKRRHVCCGRDATQAVGLIAMAGNAVAACHPRNARAVT